MYKKSISLLLIIFMIFSIVNISYATEDDYEEELDEYQEETTENDEDEIEENEKDDTDEEPQEETSQTISNEALEEYFENSLAELEQTNTLLKTISFLWCVWFIIDFLRHSFFNERSKL